MNLDALAMMAMALAAIPAGLFALNLFIYRPLPRRRRDEEASSVRSRLNAEPAAVGGHEVSVLIPARNEERNIRATLHAVLANRGCDFEVIVLDDDSSDHTAEIVNEFAGRDRRVRLKSAPPLPAGWCGKQHACHILAGFARSPLLVFIDADVRLAPDALARMAAFMENSHVQNDGTSMETMNTSSKAASAPAQRAGSAAALQNGASPLWSAPAERGGRLPGPALASGVPCQRVGTFSERLLLPLIHFILLGFLPMHAVRRTRWPNLSAGCGQLFIARRDAYEQCGGHAMLRNSLHDGIKLPRAFRRAGFATDLFDATDIASCRMYRTNAETWRGLGRNATEGLAAPGIIGLMTALLVGGQVLPFLLLACAQILSTDGLLFAAIAAALAFTPRIIGVLRFGQPLSSALLHPLGVLALLIIQWHALMRHLLGKASEWKGRTYGPVSGIEPVKET